MNSSSGDLIGFHRFSNAVFLERGHLHFLNSSDLLGSDEFVLVITKPSLLIESSVPPDTSNLSSLISNGILISLINTSVFDTVKIGFPQS